MLQLQADSEAGDSSGAQKKLNIRRWKPLPSNGSEKRDSGQWYV
jgi:hypothetical protein